MDNAKNNRKKLKQLFALLDEMEAYARCIGKVSFDMECCAPEEGIAQAGEDMATIGRQFHKLIHSKKVREAHLRAARGFRGLDRGAEKGGRAQI